LIVLVDDDDHIIGTAPKLDVNQSGALHRALSIVVWDSAKRLLLQSARRGNIIPGDCGPRRAAVIRVRAKTSPTVRAVASAKKWASPAR
jgi:hypothetical protein